MPSILTPQGVPHLPLDDTTLSRLAHEVARNMYPLDDVLKLYKIEPVVFNEMIKDHPRFMQYYAEAYTVWNSASNYRERVALKAGVMSDEFMQEANRLMHDPKEPMAPKVALFQMLNRISGIEKEKGTGVQAGERVVLNINFGASGPVVHFDKAVDAQVVEATTHFTPPTPVIAPSSLVTQAGNATHPADGEHNWSRGRVVAQDVPGK